MRYSVAILKNELPNDHLSWVKACEKNKRILSFEIIDLLADNWFEEINKKKYDLFLLKPSGILELFKRLYDERIYIISAVLNKPIYPSLTEILIYENKRFLRDWLDSQNFPHPKTNVFFNKHEALLNVAGREDFPLIAKTNIGASGNGVKTLNYSEEATSYINDAFAGGIFTKTGPRLFKGSLFMKLKKAFSQKGFLRQRFSEYSQVMSNPQMNFVILQEFIPHEFEWRAVRIGDSYFAHKKLAKNNMSSGNLLKDYGPVPLSLLDFIRTVTDRGGLSSVSIDIFQRNGDYLINEVQCIFGQSDPYQMMVNNIPGRYIWKTSKWVFEEGMFNTNQSYDLRLEHALCLIDDFQ